MVPPPPAPPPHHRGGEDHSIHALGTPYIHSLYISIHLLHLVPPSSQHTPTTGRRGVPRPLGWGGGVADTDAYMYMYLLYANYPIWSYMLFLSISIYYLYSIPYAALLSFIQPLWFLPTTILFAYPQHTSPTGGNHCPGAWHRLLLHKAKCQSKLKVSRCMKHIPSDSI